MITSNFETYKKFQQNKKLNNSHLINQLFQFDKLNLRNNTNINNSLLSQQSTKNKKKKIIFNTEKKELEKNLKKHNITNLTENSIKTKLTKIKKRKLPNDINHINVKKINTTGHILKKNKLYDNIKYNTDAQQNECLTDRSIKSNKNYNLNNISIQLTNKNKNNLNSERKNSNLLFNNYQNEIKNKVNHKNSIQLNKTNFNHNNNNNIYNNDNKNNNKIINVKKSHHIKNNSINYKKTNLLLDNNTNKKDTNNKNSNISINLINVSKNKLSSYKKSNNQKPKISINKTHHRNHSSNFENKNINNKRYSLSQDKSKYNKNETLNKTIKKDSLTKNIRNHSAVIKNEHNIKIIKKLKKEKITKKIISISFISMTGKNAENKPEKINQDSFFITSFPDFGFDFVGVCDGHGQNGHLVSNFLKENIPKNFKNEIIKKYKYLAKNNNNLDFNIIKKIFDNSFILTNSQLLNNSNIDTNFSGSTCCSLLIRNNIIFSANVGDSRAIKGKRINNKWTYDLLTIDHKPKIEKEKNRILHLGGRIEPFKENNGEFVGPDRIWLKYKQIPGLAMTRSFGDQIASTVGVISDPEIIQFNYDFNDKFIIVASDGLWEYLSVEEIVNVTGEYYLQNNIGDAIQKLYNMAYYKWSENDISIDDITIIIIFLN